jgi:hypothetical protein
MYKKNFILLACLFTIFLGFSQQQKGDLSISLTASPFPTKGENSGDFGVIGKVGMEFFLSDKVSATGSFFTSNNTVIKNDSGTTINSYGFIPTIQYYFLNKAKVNIFGQLGYGMGFDDLTRESGIIENSALTLLAIGAGVNYKIKDKLFYNYHFHILKQKI